MPQLSHDDLRLPAAIRIHNFVFHWGSLRSSDLGVSLLLNLSHWNFKLFSVWSASTRSPSNSNFNFAACLQAFFNFAKCASTAFTPDGNTIQQHSLPVRSAHRLTSASRHLAPPLRRQSLASLDELLGSCLPDFENTAFYQPVLIYQVQQHRRNPVCHSLWALRPSNFHHHWPQHSHTFNFHEISKPFPRFQQCI